jgi:hypothetical protein
MLADTREVLGTFEAERAQTRGIIAVDERAAEGELVLEGAVGVAIRDPLLLSANERGKLDVGLCPISLACARIAV